MASKKGHFLPTTQQGFNFVLHCLFIAIVIVIGQNFYQFVLYNQTADAWFIPARLFDRLVDYSSPPGPESIKR